MPTFYSRLTALVSCDLTNLELKVLNLQKEAQISHLLISWCYLITRTPFQPISTLRRDGLDSLGESHFVFGKVWDQSFEDILRTLHYLAWLNKVSSIYSSTPFPSSQSTKQGLLWQAAAHSVWQGRSWLWNMIWLLLSILAAALWSAAFLQQISMFQDLWEVVNPYLGCLR